MGLKLIIMGTTPFSIMLYKIIEKEQFASVLAFTTGRAFMDKTELEGIPIVAFEELSDSFDMNQCMILNTIGYSQMNDIRKKVFFSIGKKDTNYALLYLQMQMCIRIKSAMEALLCPEHLSGRMLSSGYPI